MRDSVLESGGALRAVIFDCDGVLFDSWRANVAFYNAVLAELGAPPLDAAGERLAHTLSSPQLFEALFRDQPAVLERARTIAHNTDYSPFLRWMEPVPGLFELLADLKVRYRLAMATNRGVTLTGVMRHFGLAPLLELAVGIYDVPRPKPFPDMIEKCVQHFGIAPGEAVYVGDSLSDLEAARAAGTHFIGVGDLPGAALRVQHIGELRAVLNEWTSR
ncbi:MAG: superfamily hydrolase [Deltaproteobacteria bacterium]|jgi:HAD superfamily hydrolase (TIGR01509 family)|nr:superfamily hydrolase [Deltaproteobacteria bacterium]